jgi:hypothetical protein
MPTKELETEIEQAIAARAASGDRRRSKALWFRKTRFIQAVLAVFDAGGTVGELQYILATIQSKTEVAP